MKKVARLDDANACGTAEPEGEEEEQQQQQRQRDGMSQFPNDCTAEGHQQQQEQQQQQQLAG
eukprot:4685956-Prorocentrum_lima.AAC.1